MRKWKRFLAVGCSHGHLADPAALKAVLDFKARWKPETVIHLGDFVDLAALRSGAAGTSDEAESISADFDAGIDFLEKLAPKLVFIGNHEDRCYTLARSNREIVAYCAGKVVGEIHDIAKKIRAELVPYDINAGWRTLGGTRFGHGYMFNEFAIRDHAESFGKCVIAHLHHPGEASARRHDGAVGYCVGTLANIPAMRYAKAQRARLRWAHGFAWGEYCDDECVVRIERESAAGGWRFPI